MSHRDVVRLTEQHPLRSNQLFRFLHPFLRFERMRDDLPSRSFISCHYQQHPMKQDVFQQLAIPANSKDLNLWRWLHGEVRAAILDGRLRPGSRLPSSRNLAAQYHVSRGTVVVAYERLAEEGLTSGQLSSGTFVTTDLLATDTDTTTHRCQPRTERSKARLAAHTQATLQSVRVLPATQRIGRAFRASEPALDLFPTELWARVASRVLRHAPRSLYGQGSASGYGPLKKAIADHVGAAKGVRCSPNQIIVTSGAQQSLDLLARFLLDDGDQVWMEDPGYTGALDTLRSAGASVIPVPVDAEGMDVKAGCELAPRAKLAYVTPSNQFPLGMTMSAKRREDLLRWARNAGAWVIEDDYDSEYRYGQQPIASLQSIDSSGSVIYVGSFSKTLFNALRIGFMVLPEALVSTFELARSFVDRHPPTLDQAVLAEFIIEGHFGVHVRKMSQLYSHRRAVLMDAFAESAGKGLSLARVETGMKALAWLPATCSDSQVASRAQSQGLEVLPISRFSIGRRIRPGLMLGFAGCDENELRRGAKLLAQVLA